MHLRDLSITATAAVATTVLTLTLVGPAPLDAALPEELALPPAPLPTLVADGVELTIEGELGDTPVARLHATNLTDEPVRINTRVQLVAQAPRAPTARMLSLPRETWTEPCLVALAPGATRTFNVTADALPAGHEGYFVVSVGDAQLASNRFAPEGLPALHLAELVVPEPDVLDF